MGSSKGGAQTVGYWYEIAFHSGLGIGPLDAYLEFRGGDRTAWKGEALHSQTIRIDAENLWGGKKDQGGIVGSVDLMFGEPTQQPNARLAGIFGPQQPAWRGLATLAFAGRYGAMSPYPQKASHKLRRIREGWDTECWYPGKAAIPMASCSGGDPYVYATSPMYRMRIDERSTVTISTGMGEIEDLIERGAAQERSAFGLSFGVAELREPLVPVEHQEASPLGITFGVAELRSPLVTADRQFEAGGMGISFGTAEIRPLLIVQKQPAEKSSFGISFGEAQLYEP